MRFRFLVLLAGVTLIPRLRANPEPAKPLPPPSEVFDLSKVTQAPVAIDLFRPVFPRDLRAAGITGKVLVDFIVDREGHVINAFAVDHPRPAFEAAAVGAVSRWRFHPGEVNGRPVYTHLRVPIVFSLPGSLFP